LIRSFAHLFFAHILFLTEGLTVSISPDEDFDGGHSGGGI